MGIKRVSRGKRPTTGPTKEYIEHWHELARPISELTGITLYGFDPDTVFYFIDENGVYRSVSLPVWFLELVNKGLQNKVR